MALDTEGLISHSGAFLITELADRLGLTKALSSAMAPTRSRRSVHDPGVVLKDLAVSIADGGDYVSNFGVLEGQGNSSARSPPSQPPTVQFRQLAPTSLKRSGRQELRPEPTLGMPESGPTL